MSPSKNSWIKWIGILLAIIPFIWIYRRLDFHTMLAILPKVSWWTIPVFFAGTFSSMAIQGTRWWILLNAFTKIPFFQVLSYHFISVYYSSIFPTSAGQEILRTLFVLKKAGAAVSWGAAWICKIASLMISLLFSIYGLASLSRLSLPRGLIIGILGLCFLIILLGVISFSKNFTGLIRRSITSIIPKRILATIENIREGIYQYRNKRKEMALVLSISFLIQLVMVLNSVGLILGITNRMCFWECLAFIPLIEIASMSVPLTPNGIGIREALTALMFKYIGLSNEQLGVYIFIALSANLFRLVGLVPIFSMKKDA